MTSLTTQLIKRFPKACGLTFHNPTYPDVPPKTNLAARPCQPTHYHSLPDHAPFVFLNDPPKQQPQQHSSAMVADAAVLRRLTKELLELTQNSPCEGIRVLLNEHDMTDIQADLEGPTGTPFEGGVFRVRLALPHDFPASAPKGSFATKIFHPNVSTSGEICVNVLKKDWSPDLGLRHVLMVIRCLLIEPFPESALNEEAGRLLLNDYEEYARHARLMTSIHAQPPKRATPLTASGANAAGSLAAAGGDAARKEEADTSPSLKKAKASDAGSHKASAGVSKVKKSLRRL